MKRLRVAKRRASLAIGMADIAAVWPLERVTGALSDFASATLGAVCAHLLRALHDRRKLALPAPETPQQGSGLIVLGMGKLGAGELNYSSDVDIIVIFDEDIASDASGDGLQQTFARLARNLVTIMDERTADGYVFRTDLRLRPRPRLHWSGSLGPRRRGLLRDHRRELGAGRDDQGQARGRRHRGRRRIPGTAAALHLAPPSRLRRYPEHPLDQAPNRRPPRRRAGRRRRTQHQARAGRHPRDRVPGADPAAHLGRARPCAPRARHQAGLRPAGHGRPRAPPGGRRADGGLHLPPHRRAPAADGGRSADPQHAGGRRGRRAGRDLPRLRDERCLCRGAARPSADGGAPLHDALRGRAGAGDGRHPRLQRRRRRRRHAGDPRRHGLRPSGARVRDAQGLARGPLPRRAQRRSPRAADGAGADDPGCPRRLARSRFRARALRRVSPRACRPAPTSSPCSPPIPNCST